jgi:hypothetical protein
VSDTDNLPRRVELLAGKVEAGRFGEGSKSARDAVWIETDQGRFVLRRKDGPSFGDKELKKYVGKRVECSGFIVGYTFLAEKIMVVADPE